MGTTESQGLKSVISPGYIIRQGILYDEINIILQMELTYWLLMIYINKQEKVRYHSLKWRKKEEV